MKKETLTVGLIILTCLMSVYLILDHLLTKQETHVIRCEHPNREYSFDVIDDSISVYTEDDKLVGTVLMEGQLDSLIIMDNQ
jgi:hypothetical protein